MRRSNCALQVERNSQGKESMRHHRGTLPIGLTPDPEVTKQELRSTPLAWRKQGEGNTL